MPRVSWFSVQLLCLLLDCLWWNRYVSADCWYNTARYKEGQEVTTAEPCLNCTCTKGTLVCYLRICPKLPNPPPIGCILLYRYKTCCPELICHDTPVTSYYVEGRSEVDDFDLMDRGHTDSACIANGTIYAPGSAMDSSTFCEYCYCLGGKERCVKPKCLLPVEGCTPVYSLNSCCPVHYNCTESRTRTSTTTTSPEFVQDSCLVAGKVYPKGHKILGVGHSACDNCYCIKGLVRCEPLSCAPPLLGCLPVIKFGECCAASYNCSGTIETRPEPNYGNFPIVSKEYAKFRKETTGDKKNTSQAMGNSIPTKAHRVSGYYGTTRHFASNALDRSTTKPYLKVRSTATYPETDYRNRNEKIGTVKNNFDPKETLKESVHNSIEGRTNVGLEIDNDVSSTTNSDQTDLTSTTEFTTLEDSTTDLENQTDPTENEVTMLASTIFDFFTQEFFKDALDEEVTENTTSDLSTTVETTTAYNLDPITLKTVTNTTDCIEDVQPGISPQLEKKISNGTVEGNSAKNGNINVEDDVTVVNLESKVKVSTVTIRPLEKLPPSILTFNKDKEDYDYDIQPTLPPSLPNLKIIPFLPSDALDAKKKVEEKKRYPLLDERVTDANIYTFTNLFSPPIETEGGFVPKEPPLLDNFYDKYHTTGVESNAVTAITVSPITKQSESKEGSCLSEGLEIRHGEAVTSKNVCVVCVCYYGDIVCQDPQCPALKKGCRETGILDRTTCCPRIICGDEDPQNLILDHLVITSNPKDVITGVDGIVSQDPFKDVIRTEPAPNLQTLIGDLPDYLRRKSQSTTANSSTVHDSTTQKPTTKTDELSLDRVLQLLLSDADEEKATVTPVNVSVISTEGAKRNVTKEIADNTVDTNVVRGNDVVGVGPLKLAGCNIYGRMYRVGRIISELSGPCLECKCTEVGVQCKKLC